MTETRVVGEWLYLIEGNSDVAVFEREDGGARPSIRIGPGLSLDEGRAAFFSLQVPEARQTLADLLREADTGIVGVRLVTPAPQVQERIDRGERFSPAEAAELSHGNIRLLFDHRGADGSITPLPMWELSDGTRRLLRIAWVVHSSPHLTTCFIDELDRSLHTQLTRFLVQRLNTSEGTSQFIFTTHDTNLLDAGVFGRDAIWFVERDEAGASHLYSLASFDKAQLDAMTGHVEEGYLQGRFGAIPFLGDPKRLRWERA